MEAHGLNIVSRAKWGANESWSRNSRSVDNVHMAVVHHTAHASGSAANSYSRAEAPGLMRSFHRYHTRTLGWSDIGYNVVVDRFGTIYEGRRGGFTNGVIGAHSAGWNTGSFGVAVMGNFAGSQASAAAITALTDVIATKAAIHGIDTTATTTRVGNGSRRPTVVGHRDVGQTSCPGRIHDLLPTIREGAKRAEARVEIPRSQLPERFPFVPIDSPHRAAILALADAGVTRGCSPNRFCPNETLTRGQAASFAVRAFELEPVRGSRFTDAPAGMTHAAEINALVELGWFEGYPDGTFQPHRQLTRAQLGSLLARSLPDVPVDAGTVPTYPDVEASSVHYDGIMALAAHGVRGDCGDGRFCPNAKVTRAQTASFVHAVRAVHGLHDGT